MKCPVDRSDMLVVEHNHVEVDYCDKCRGVWFDSGELDLMLRIKSAAGTPSNIHLHPEPANTTESKRRCPICRRKMDKVWLGQPHQVLIDSCPRGDGLWFDGGELRQLLAETDSIDDSVLAFLDDTFKVEGEGGDQ